MRGGIRQGLHGGQSARRRTAERDFPERRRSFPGYSLVQCPSLERYRLIHEHAAARRHGKRKSYLRLHLQARSYVTPVLCYLKLGKNSNLNAECRAITEIVDKV